MSILEGRYYCGHISRDRKLC